MGDIPSKCNEISQCYITLRRNPFCYLIDVPLQNLQPVKCESNKCLFVIVKGISEIFFDDIYSVCSTTIF